MRPDFDARLLFPLGLMAAIVFFAVLREISSRRRLRRLSQDADRCEQRLHQILHASPAAIIFFDDRGTIRGMNPAAERLFGFVEDEVRGHNFQLLIRFSEAAPGLGFQKIARLQVDLKAVASKRSGLEFLADVVITQMLPRREKAFLAFVSEARGDRQARGRLEELECSARRVAVELNDVLTKIVGYSDLLHESIDGDQRENIAQITAAGQRAAALGNQLLDLSRNGKAAGAATGAPGAATSFDGNRST